MNEDDLIAKYFEGELTRDESESMAALRRKSPKFDRHMRLLENLRHEPLPALLDDARWDAAVVRRARLRMTEAAPTWLQKLRFGFGSPRPAWVVALLVAAVAMAGRFSMQGVSPIRGANVEFILVHASAGSVSVAGDFNAWEPGVLRLHKVNGVWRGAASLPPGVYQYQFIVDGNQWMADPAAGGKAEDGFGRVNSVVRVGSKQQAL